MLDVSWSEEELTVVMSSEWHLLNAGVHACENFVRRHVPETQGDVSLVVRELLANAITHGNRLSAEKSVACRMRSLGKQRFEIVVQDEGQGFDPRGLDMALPEDPRRVKSRGYRLISLLAESIRFSERGNQVSVTVDLARDRKTGAHMCSVAIG